MQTEAQIRATFAKQAVWCAQLGSPLTARLVAGLGVALDRSTKTGRRVLDWQGRADALGDAVALRLAGALNALVRSGRLPELAAHYPPNDLPDGAVLTQAALAAIVEADKEICGWLGFPPQTNEVARSAVLYPGMCFIAQKTGLPLALYEVGASGGLNLFADRFAYQFGDARRGDSASGVVLSPEWSGAEPPVAEAKIVRRMGCDQSPLDVTREDHRNRLMAYIWPDQPTRIDRIKAALEIAQRDPPDMAMMDAADWVEAEIEKVPEAGVTRVLFHSIAYQYFPPAVKLRIVARMEAAGVLATLDAPLAWLAFEQHDDDGPRLTLRLWPGGKVQELAVAGAHVHAIDWKG
ncbi:MAG: DUF2332 domain-containing protein [Marinosulfonomonas sp.]|nr:DUF2332 domain-containing protein [Marinosulfonomonas sp.]